MKKLVTNKLYMTLYASDLLSNFGDVMYYLALMTYVMQLPDAKLAIAIVSFSETLPILTGFVIGYVADRTVKKVETIIQTLLFRVVLYLLVALVMGLTPSLGVVIIASVVNFLSDLSGQYENGLYVPLSLRIVADEDRAMSYSFKQAVSSVCSIAFQSTGAILVSVMSYQILAVANAGTFAISLLVMLAVKPGLNQLLAKRPVDVTTKREEHLIKDMWSGLKTAIDECLKIPEIKAAMVVSPLLNGFLSGLSIIIPVLITQDEHFVLINPATTLAAISIIQLTGGIIGSLLGMSYLKEVPMMIMIRSAVFLVPIISVSLYCHLIYGVLMCLFAVMIIAACVNPKMMAIIMNTMPEEKLAMISGGAGTYFQLGAIAMRLVVSALIVVLPVDWISLICLVGSLGMTVYVIANRPEHKVA